MAIDKSIAQAPTRSDSTVTEEELQGLDVDAEDSAVEIAVVNPEVVSIATEEGGVVIDFDPTAGEGGGTGDFDSNLAEHMEDNVLRRLASQLNGEFEGDRNSRSDWARFRSTINAGRLFARG